jgi:ferritin-like metal-binding protein YciE
MKALEDLFLQALEDMYGAETRIAKALPELIEVATCPELKLALETHLRETESHIARLEEVFEALNKEPRGKNCATVAGILDEAEDLVTRSKHSPGLNAAIACAGQKFEHYEIANYGCLQSWAEAIENGVAAGILSDLLDGKKSAYRYLSEVAVEEDDEALEAAQR